MSQLTAPRTGSATELPGQSAFRTRLALWLATTPSYGAFFLPLPVSCASTLRPGQPDPDLQIPSFCGLFAVSIARPLVGGELRRCPEASRKGRGAARQMTHHVTVVSLLILVASIVSGADAAYVRHGIPAWASERPGRAHVLRGLRGGGLLVQGTPLAWEDSLQWLGSVDFSIPHTRSHAQGRYASQARSDQPPPSALCPRFLLQPS